MRPTLLYYARRVELAAFGLEADQNKESLREKMAQLRIFDASPIREIRKIKSDVMVLYVPHCTFYPKSDLRLTISPI